MISRSTIDKVFDAARVEEVVGDFVQLKRAGANFKGLSPFSEEKTPSFMVSPSKGIWKDFSSGKGGNAVSFIVEMEHCSFPDAIRYLAKKYGIEVEEDRSSPEQEAARDERESLYIVSDFAAGWFAGQLHDTEMGRAVGRTYFTERGFTEATMRKFVLGYSPDEWTAFTDAAVAAGYKQEFLDKTGLSIKRSDGRLLDRFRGRVIFPIHGFSGRVTGFGGRVIGSDKNTAKYLNSPESEIYHKSDILYGLYQAKSAIVKNNMCYLVEGYTDVIQLHQAGIENVVASSGTALTAGQIKLIKRLTPNITVLYDGDAAGIKASFRGIDLLLEEDMNVRALTFPDGDDPDSFARKHSDEELKDHLEKSQSDFITFKAGLLLDDAKGDPIKRSEFIRDIVESISKIQDPIKREVYIGQCSKLLDISEQSLARELAQIDKRNLKEEEKEFKREGERTGEMKLTHSVKKGKFDVLIGTLEAELVRLVLSYPDMKLEITDIQLKEDENGQLVKKQTAYENTLAKEIFESLEADELSLLSEDLAELYILLKQDFIEKGEINTDDFTRHKNERIMALTIDLLSRNHEPVSENWLKKKAYVPAFEKVASRHVKETILRYKELRTLILTDEIKLKITSEETSEDQKKDLYLHLEHSMAFIALIRRELGERVV